MKLPAWTYLIAFGMGIGLCWYIMRGCNKPDQAAIDKINRLSAVNDSIVGRLEVVNHHDDSVSVKIKADSVKYVHVIDSQSRVISIWQGRLSVTKDSIGVLYRKLRELYLANDTVSLVAAYEELGNQLQQAKEQIAALEIARDTANSIQTQEIARLNGIIDQLQAEIKELKALLLQCTDNSAELAKTGLKAAKKAKVAALISKIGLGLSGVLALLLLTHK